MDTSGFRQQDPMFSTAPTEPDTTDEDEEDKKKGEEAVSRNQKPCDKRRTRQLLESQESAKPGKSEDEEGEEEVEEVDDCPICMCPVEDPEKLAKCGHVFCKDCIKQCFEKNKPVCPICGMVYGKIIGNQPKNGTINVAKKSNLHLPGYKKFGAVVIEYDFPSGIQTVSTDLFYSDIFSRVQLWPSFVLCFI